MKVPSSLIYLTGACILCGALAAFFASPRPLPATTPSAADTSAAPVQPTTRVSFLVFNTQATLTFFDPASPELDAAARDIVDRLSLLHATINAFDPHSELARLNDSAAQQPFACSPLLWDIILRAQDAWNLSDHLFDATVGPLLKLWGFHAKQDTLPSDEQIHDALNRVGFDKIILDNNQHTVRFTRPGMRLDFGGIAKGYALKLAIDIAAQHHLRDYLIDLGGNIYCSENTRNPDTPFRTVGIRNPRQTDTIVDTVRLRGQCIATSGNYERYRVIQGRRIGHIMDPRTGRPIDPPEHYEGVTAITADPTFSDIASTTAFVGGPETARRLVAATPGTAFAFVAFHDDGTPSVSWVK